MRFRSRPLLVSGVDAELYVARPEIERALVGAVLSERDVLISGPTGSGKTTSLRKLEADLRQRDRLVTWVNASLASNGVHLLELVEAAVLTAATQAGHRLRPPDEPVLAGDAAGPLQLMNAVNRIPPQPATVIFVDGTLEPAAGYDVFGRLRDQLWALPHSWVVATTPERVGALRTPPADAFWGAYVEIGPMDGQQVRTLLERGLDWEEAKLVFSGIRPESGVPRRIIHAVEEYLEQPRMEEYSSHYRPPAFARQEAAAELGRSASMALAELEALGRPAAAGDDELLARTGWSRAYLGRTLSQLEAAEILRSYPGPTSGQGRPPKLYEPNPEFRG